MKVILINAIWCSGCIVMKKNWQKVRELHPEIEFETLDYDFDEDEVKSYNPGTILPVAIFFNNDKEFARLNGEKTIAEILDIVEGR